MSDTGRTVPLTVITPIRPGLTPWLRLFFFLRRHAPRWLGNKLRDLSLIQSARWAIITRLADNGPAQRKERLRYDYLLFESNFNGGLEPYIDAFARVLPLRIRLIWGSCFGFPGVRPVGRFTDYIRGNDLRPGHYYQAYPDASVKEVVAALDVCTKLQPLLTDAGSLTPEAFGARYGAFLTTVQQQL